ncbi:uncharacterized protein LOC129983816 [Argiope bruennichi]|uniref:uncharacterized protein LOC129983816 n=1 Tax=Argiope bruennichi TaxID=94029 RepID=UPI00249539FE|nr:uncharacterized protein LOC129983816 [Argiope bruennichi]
MTPLWGAVIVIFLAQKGCFGDFLADIQESCAADGSCWNYYEINYLPITEEDLNSYCPLATKNLWCLIGDCMRRNFRGTIVPSNKSADIMHTVLDMTNILIDICTPDSELRKNYLSSIPCFNVVLRSKRVGYKCNVKAFEVYDNYIQSLDRFVDEDSEEMRRDKDCLTTAYSLACLAAETKETCGEDKSNMVMDILNRAKILKFVGCTDENIEELNTTFFDFLNVKE